MAVPMQMYLLVHDAILREVAEYEERARDLNRDDAEEVGAFSDRFSRFFTLLKAHENSEEEVLFPTLEERYRYIAASYEFDHDHVGVHVLDDMGAALTGLGRAESKGDRVRLAQRVHRESIALNEILRLHIAKENELLLPVVDDLFGADEQVALMGRMAGTVEPQLMGQMVAWMFTGQNVTDREMMLRVLMRTLPAEAFGGLTQMLSGTVSSAEWQEMEGRIPELAQAPE